MSAIDALFMRAYHDEHYNCSHFTVEAYKILTGIDISDLLLGFMRSTHEREIFKNIRKNFRQVRDIKNKTLLCLMANNHEKHAGILHENKILHLRKDRVEYQNIVVASRFFKKVDFYECLRKK